MSHPKRRGRTYRCGKPRITIDSAARPRLGRSGREPHNPITPAGASPDTARTMPRTTRAASPGTSDDVSARTKSADCSPGLNAGHLTSASTTLAVHIASVFRLA
jgi:hypothetical protein